MPRGGIEIHYISIVYDIIATSTPIRNPIKKILPAPNYHLWVTLPIRVGGGFPPPLIITVANPILKS